MKRSGMAKLALVAGLATLVLGSVAASAQGLADGPLVSERVKKLTRGVPWRQVGTIAVKFNTQHPQGMVRVGDVFYVSSVEITTPTKRFAAPQDGYDRDTGAGAGHLFKFDMAGNLLADLPLGEGSIYHPGGIDFDGTSIWVPAAEYRPNSRAIIYRVDLATFKATEVFRYGDHIGGLVRNTRNGSLHGVSWGSRRFYTWTVDASGRVTNADVPPEKLRVANPSGYIDYQDCKYLGGQEALCAGLNSYQMKKDGPRFPLGGFEIVDLAANRAVFQIPVELWTDSGLPMTQNPFWIETTPRGLRAYFMPEDVTSTVYIYEADVQ